jgi:hypothetical protein
MGNGNSWNTSRTLSASAGGTSFIMAANRAQYGHWKSEKTAMVIPMIGCSPTNLDDL